MVYSLYNDSIDISGGYLAGITAALAFLGFYNNWYYDCTYISGLFIAGIMTIDIFSGWLIADIMTVLTSFMGGL